MSSPALVLAVVLATACVISGSGRGDVLVMEALICPYFLDIEPCVCTNSSISLNMDCSDVLDEYQLAAVFTADFPSKTFNDFTIKDNPWLTRLPDYVFGEVTFETITIARGALVTVDEFALTDTASTIQSLMLYENNLSEFPFHTLASFTSLEVVSMAYNNLQGLPALSSSTLQRLYINKNPLGQVAVDTFVNTPNLTTIYLQETQLTELIPGTLSGMPNLKEVYLYRNFLTEIQPSTVEFSASVKGAGVYLSLNNITNIAVNAFPGLQGGSVEVQHNALTELPEDVWRPLLEEGVNIRPYGNPLVCGCDIAWLLNTTFIGQIEPMLTECENGTLVAFLDPQAFDYCDATKSIFDSEKDYSNDYYDNHY